MSVLVFFFNIYRENCIQGKKGRIGTLCTLWPVFHRPPLGILFIFSHCKKVSMRGTATGPQPGGWRGVRGTSQGLCLVTQLCATLWDPMDCGPPGSSVHGHSPSKNTGAGCHALLQGIFPTQGSNPGLPHCRWILYRLSHQGSPPGIWQVEIVEGRRQEVTRGMLRVLSLAAAVLARELWVGGRCGGWHG